MTFTAPIAQLRFTLDAIADLPSLYGKSAFAEFTPDLADAILEEGGKFARDVLAPLNRVGDTEGTRLENGVVRLPKGFAEAYAKFVEGGWNGVTGVTEFGGQGLPHTLGIALQELWQ